MGQGESLFFCFYFFEKKLLTNKIGCYNLTNQREKPMIKRSSLSNQLSESCGWWNRNSERMGEWTYEGGRKRKRVVTDGKRTRYQSVTVWLYSGKSG